MWNALNTLAVQIPPGNPHISVLNLTETKPEFK